MRITTPFRWLLTGLLIVAITAVSIVPGNPKPGDSAFVWFVAQALPVFQKTMHFIVYGALAWLWVWSLESRASWRTRLIVAFLFCVIFGAMLEWWQTFVPGRFGMLFDVLLNAAGVATGLMVAKLSLYRRSD